MKVFIPIKLDTPNIQKHWTKKHKTNKMLRFILKAYLNIENLGPSVRSVATLTRHGTRTLDDDNLAFCFKFVRDFIADQLFPGLAPGQADCQESITWVYKQQKCKRGKEGITVEISLAEETQKSHIESNQGEQHEDNFTDYNNISSMLGGHWP